MKHKLLTALFLLALSINAGADTLEVNKFRYSGPITVAEAFALDTVDVNGLAWRPERILDLPFNLSMLSKAPYVSVIPGKAVPGLHLIGFTVQNESFAKASVSIDGCTFFKVYIDGKELDTKQKAFDPGTHDVVVKIYSPKPPTSLKIKMETSVGKLTLREDGRKRFSMDVNSDCEICTGISVSPGGEFAAIRRQITQPGGKKISYSEIFGINDGSVYARVPEEVNWMPTIDAYYYKRGNCIGEDLICLDPKSGIEKIVARNIPEGAFKISPAGDCLIYSLEQKGPKEGDVHEILSPEDRQPGWRDRWYLARYDIATGLMQPMTFGYRNAHLLDISADGSEILFRTSFERMRERPTTVFSIYRMNVRTLEVTPVVENDGFVIDAGFSPSGDDVMVTGSPEAFDGISNLLKANGRYPSYYQTQIFVVSKDKKVRTLTRGFRPAPQQCIWNKFDNKIYFTAQEKDCVNLYRINTANGDIERIQNMEDNVRGMSISKKGQTLVYYGQGLENGDRAYYIDLRLFRQTKIMEISSSHLADVDMGKGMRFEFTNSRGDKINGFYVLPPDFDQNKKYPMIVHYYGGCSPTTRYCIGSYSPQWYASQGYIFYVINPSGASGNGQEFAARHVNTAGEGVAEDIIEGTKIFCENHPYVDTKHIGCFSASYGGFMTQLLLTKTNIFATGISHAGISSHTSYWGEGYWGYSYSEVAMAGSYPWTRKDLYVDRSPLYNADKIHTPLLFLHGSADTNVPIGESIQMYTALKLLGQDTAFVVVDGENHGIRDYDKKRQWLRTISAWFAKYLKEDPSWWNELYPPKTL